MQRNDALLLELKKSGQAKLNIPPMCDHQRQNGFNFRCLDKSQSAPSLRADVDPTSHPNELLRVSSVPSHLRLCPPDAVMSGTMTVLEEGKTVRTQEQHLRGQIHCTLRDPGPSEPQVRAAPEVRTVKTQDGVDKVLEMAAALGRDAANWTVAPVAPVKARRVKNNASYELAQQSEVLEQPRPRMLNTASYELAQQCDYMRPSRAFQRMDACEEEAENRPQEEEEEEEEGILQRIKKNSDPFSVFGGDARSGPADEEEEDCLETKPIGGPGEGGEMVESERASPPLEVKATKEEPRLWKRRWRQQSSSEEHAAATRPQERDSSEDEGVSDDKGCREMSSVAAARLAMVSADSRQDIAAVAEKKPERKKTGLGGFLQRFSKLRFSGRSKVPRSEVKVVAKEGNGNGAVAQVRECVIIPLHGEDGVDNAGHYR